MNPCGFVRNRLLVYTYKLLRVQLLVERYGYRENVGMEDAGDVVQ